MSVKRYDGCCEVSKILPMTMLKICLYSITTLVDILILTVNAIMKIFIMKWPVKMHSLAVATVICQQA